MRKVIKAGEGRETAIEIELKGMTVEKATNTGRQFSRGSAAQSCSRQNCHATQARVSPSKAIQDSLGFWI